jgi:hypothetical protein
MKSELVASWIIVNGRLDMCWTAMATMQLLDMPEFSNRVEPQVESKQKAA